MLRPVAGSVEITSKCNAFCEMCPWTYNDVAANATNMDKDAVLDLLDQEVAMGCKTLLPHHLGEPTLHPNYVEIIRTTRERHPDVELKLFTNGSMLHHEEIYRVFVECADAIVVSLDGIRPETMDSIRPGLDAKKIFKHATKLAKDPNRRGSIVTQGVTVLGKNEHEVEGYSRVWRARGFDEGYPYLDIRARKPVFPNPCSRIYTQVDVRIDGTVGVCCRDSTNMYPLGNAFEEGIEAIWYGEKARAFRRAHRAGEIDLCNTCTWEGVFEGDPEELE